MKFKPIILASTLTAALGIHAAIQYQAHLESKCLRKEDQLVHHEEWAQYLYVNGIMIPMTQPAYNAVETVCVEYANQ